MASDRKIFAGFRCDRGIWFRWKALCQAHGVRVEQAIETLIAEKLEQLQIQDRERPDDSAPAKVEVPGMVRS